MTGNSACSSVAPSSIKRSNVWLSTQFGRACGTSILLITTTIRWPACRAFLSTNFVCGIGPSLASTSKRAPLIMRMVNGALLLVDAKDGPMPQTKFVLKKALQAGHRIVVVINKIDVPQARPNWVLNHTFDLFIELGATEEQAEFPVIYTSAVQGKAGREPHLETMTNIEPLFELIAREIPPPRILDTPMQMLVVNTLYDNYKGHIAVGLLLSRSIRKNQPIMQIKTDGARIPGKALAVMSFDGLNRVEVDAGP